MISATLGVCVRAHRVLLRRHTLYSTLFDPVVMSVLCRAPNYFSPGCVFVCLSAALLRSDFGNVNEKSLQR